VKRIFLTLALLANGSLIVSAILGLNIGDSQQRTLEVQGQIGTHMLTALAAMCFVALVHAICFTYFMGTGRWLEETSNA
jgi:hypothetical protein